MISDGSIVVISEGSLCCSECSNVFSDRFVSVKVEPGNVSYNIVGFDEQALKHFLSYNIKAAMSNA